MNQEKLEIKSILMILLEDLGGHSTIETLEVEYQQHLHQFEGKTYLHLVDYPMSELLMQFPETFTLTDNGSVKLNNKSSNYTSTHDALFSAVMSDLKKLKENFSNIPPGDRTQKSCTMSSTISEVPELTPEEYLAAQKEREELEAKRSKEKSEKLSCDLRKCLSDLIRSEGSLASVQCQMSEFFAKVPEASSPIDTSIVSDEEETIAPNPFDVGYLEELNAADIVEYYSTVQDVQAPYLNTGRDKSESNFRRPSNGSISAFIALQKGSCVKSQHRPRRQHETFETQSDDELKKQESICSVNVADITYTTIDDLECDLEVSCSSEDLYTTAVDGHYFANLSDEPNDFVEFPSGVHCESRLIPPQEIMKSLPVDHFINHLEFPPLIQDPSQQLPAQKILTGKFVLHLAEVYSPVIFWFHEGDASDRMGEDLNHDYKNLSALQLAISDDNIKKGLLVANSLKEFNNDWYRSIVVEALNENEREKVRLLHLDWGTVGMVDKKNIKLLLQKYLKTPRLAYRGRFVNLKPPSGQRQWEEHQVESFLCQFSNTKLSAEVVKYDERENVYELNIFQQQRTIVDLREWLTNRHLADSFELEEGNIYPMCYYFPSFHALENTGFPTFDEQSLMRDDGIDHNLMVETNSLSRIDRDFLVRTPRLLKMLGHEKFKEVKDFMFPPRRDE